MRYVLLIREPLGQRATRTEAQGRQLYDRMLGFAAELQSRGVLVAAESLADMGPQTARLQVREGRRSVIDGPFTESKEVVGGYAITQCKDKAEALEWTKRFLEVHPEEWTVTVEVREIAEG